VRHPHHWRPGRPGPLAAHLARVGAADDRTYGRDNPWVQAYILGVFPTGTLNTLLSPDQVRDAMDRHARPEDYQFAQKRIGIDVARFGDDATVLFPRQGIVARNPVELRGAKSHEIAARVILGKQNFGSEVEFIDDTGGWASGVIDACELGERDAHPDQLLSGAPRIRATSTSAAKSCSARPSG
jgi:hypothetical protein